MNDFGQYMRDLREGQRLSLRDAAAKAGVSVSYIMQVEHGKRKAPSPDVLKKLALAYSVPVRDVMKAAGYLDELKETRLSLSDEEEVDRAFQFAVTDPRFQLGTRIDGSLTIGAKRFIVEMYEKSTGKKLLPGD